MFDVSFDFASIPSGGHLGVIAKGTIYGSNDPEVYFRLRYQSGLFAEMCTMDGPVTTVLETVSIGVTNSGRVRLVAHGNFFTVFLNDAWKFTFAYRDVKWRDGPPDFFTSAVMSVTNLVSRELYAWREAVYIEMEAVGTNALQSVIQERPVEVYPVSMGGLSFSYNHERSEVALNPDTVHFHRKSSSIPSEAGSEALLYYSGVKMIYSPEFEKRYGFMTRTYRISNLDDDGPQAGRALLTRSIQSAVRHQINLRPDLRLENGDVVSLSYQISGTGTSSGEVKIVIEEIQLSLLIGEIEMTVIGRQYDD